MALLVVTWDRGAPRKVADADDPRYYTMSNDERRELFARGEMLRLHYAGDAPIQHNKFRDAELVGNTWTWRCKVSKADARSLGNDALRRLRSWGITGEMQIIR